MQAEDVIELSRPPVFLRLAGNDGWVFDRRGHTLVCEDVTEKSRYIFFFTYSFVLILQLRGIRMSEKFQRF